MRRLVIFSAIAILFTGNSWGQENTKNDNRFIIGQVDSLESEILGELRKIWVYLPKDYKTVNSQMKYPVIYLLDGNAYFHSVTGMIEFLALTEVIPKMAIVAIPNTNRGRDLTTTHVDVSIWTRDSTPDSGGGEQFMDFIEQELIPYVESKYSLSDFRTLIGHSLGGLTVIHTLVNRSYMFDNYIAVEPSLWWDNQYLLKAADTAQNKPKYERKSLFIGIAHTLSPDVDINILQTDTTRSTLHMRSLLEFVNSTESKKTSRLNFGWEYYANDDHGSVAFISVYDALRFMFPWYKLRIPEKYYSQPYSKKYENELINLIMDHYDTISYHFGYEVLPPEKDIYNLGQGFNLFHQKPEYSLALFSLNIKNYPNSIEALEAMGNYYYLIKSDTTKAIEFFSKAVEIGDSEASKSSVEMLKKLRK
jgi:predicted alpha/beta superfamily hydrolase